SDAQALGFANRMKKQSGDTEGKIICLTMGPPMAEEVLRYSLARHADMAVLLTDRALGGADTWATANPLAYAIRKIIKDILKDDQDYYIVSGMQSVDGDTAQVPPQIAEELDIPCIAYATDSEYKNGKFEFTRIVSGGSQVVAARTLPAVITVAKYEYPVFATFADTRKARDMKVIKWAASDINAPQTGVKDSKTRVIRVFPPGKSTRKCQHVSDPQSFAKIIMQSFESSNGDGVVAGNLSEHYILPPKRKNKFDRSFEGTQKESEDYNLLAEKLTALGIDDVEQITDETKEKILEAAGKQFHKKALDDMLDGLKQREASYNGHVWVVAEHRNGRMFPATFELIGKARDLADSLDTEVGVVVAGKLVEHFAKELIAAGADNVYIIEDELLEEFDPRSYRKVISDAIKKYWPQIVLFAATPQGRMLAPLVSYRVECGLTADCTSLDIKDSSRKGQVAVLMQTRPALGGNVMATICTKDSRSQMATARPGVMKRLADAPSRKGKVIRHDVVLTEDDLSLDILNTELGSGEVNFGAEVIVSGGKGMQSRDSYEKLVGSLCDALQQKTDMAVERGASRAAVEQGFIERVHQVGQTGTAVGPKLYVAVGISGAIQHMIGVANSGTIIAINSDPNAPIFKQCDYYIVGTAEQVIPQLVGSLQSYKKA
ncbi:MAG: FAD-binding protein, partial [Phycisphaerae bacterium]|nr:FAD-binding protein [Phycisphaerae bacterium]